MLTLPNVVFSLPPTPCTAVIIAIAIPAAIRPYSIAVAPDSSAINLLKMPFNFNSLTRLHLIFQATRE